jgi:hypothetical protein
MNAQHFQVTIVTNSTTEHEITVDSAYASSLCHGELTTAVLIEKSFEFLLARESNTRILRRFDLSVIGRYFPEYETEISP